MNIKIMCWNVLYGFHDYNLVYNSIRAEAAKQFIHTINPDILLLVEACFGNENVKNIKFDYENFYKSNFYYYKSEIDEWGYSLYSKWEIESTPIYFQHRNPMLVNIKLPHTKLNLATYHPHPRWIEEIKCSFFEYLVENKKDPFMIIGDFNTTSPLDKNPWNYIPRVIPMFESYGLIDSFYDDRTPTFPTKLQPVTPNSPICKLDHCFTTPDIKILNKKVINNNPLVDIASDHYPLYLEVEI